MRMICLCLAVLLTVLPAMPAQGEGITVSGVTAEINTEYRTDLYPYVVHAESADWYIAKADIEKEGLEELCAGIAGILEDQELDFADAREALSGYLSGPVPKVIICTDFSGHAEISNTSSAYYNAVGNFIKVFHNWTSVRASLMHEYVHYLTFRCTGTAIRSGFWAEGAAEYITRLLCRNRLSRSVNMGLVDEEVLFFREKGAWDPQENCIDEKLLYYGVAELFRSGAAVGEKYYAVSSSVTERTEKMQQNIKAYELSFQEAACMTAYLIETYGEETVFTHWDTDPEQMEQVFGSGFPELYRAWGDWNTRRCEELGLTVP